MPLSEVAFSQVMDALGHPRRVRLFNILKDHYPSWFEYAELALSAEIPTASLAHHIRMLARGGLIRKKQVSRYSFISLRTDCLAQANDILRDALDTEKTLQTHHKYLAHPSRVDTLAKGKSYPKPTADPQIDPSLPF